MIIEIGLSFIITMIVSTLLIPVVINVGNKLNIVAKMNERTVHKKEIVRIGGVAIYLSFLVGALIFLKTDSQINAILIAGFLVFMVGLYDDVHDLSPKIKLIVQIIAALIVIIYGDIYLKGFNFIEGDTRFIPGFITLLWIVGITNAINLIDGLDGLSSGISIIVLITISLTSFASGRTDIASLSLVLAGAIMGFLFYNFHPAKIFLGDSGALFIGFMISAISLLGFGYNTSTFFTLGAPICVLAVPIFDTLIAIIRRKLNNKKFSDADRKHLHHNLMFQLKLGHTKSVLVLYGVTILFSITSFIYLYDPTFGIIIFLILMFMFQLFVEMTGMIGRRYKPILTILNIFINSDDLPKIRAIERIRRNKKLRKKIIYSLLVILLLITGMGLGYINQKDKTAETVHNKTPYILTDENNKLLKRIYDNLDSAYQNDNREEECKLVAVYFLCDYLTLENKDEEVGGLDYIYPNLVKDFKQYALKSHYLNIDQYPDLAVKDYEIISFSPSNIKIPELQNNKYYDVLISYSFNQVAENISTTATVTVVLVDNRFYIIGIDDI